MAPGRYQHDVFISYAHADNVPVAGSDLGWVTIFAENLKNFLSRKLSRDADVWMDHRELRGNQPLTPAIMEALRKTATIVVLTSQRYRSSEWCKRERENFLEFINDRNATGSRVFRAEIDKVDGLPGVFDDTIGFPFWITSFDDPTPQTLGFPVPDPQKDDEYFKRLNRMVFQLAAELERINETNQAFDSAATGSGRGYIFLAEATDDLDSKREEIKDYLSQAGFNVLPDSWRSYEDLDAYQGGLDQDLSKCKVFAQVLSEFSGKRPFNQRRTYPELQNERARAAGKTILQWRSDKTAPDTVKDPEYRALLEGLTVRVESFEEFKRAVVEAAETKPATPPPVAGKFVFISADIPDRARAEQLINPKLDTKGIGHAMAPSGDPEAVRHFTELSLENCDAAVVVYCATDQASVLGQVLQCRKVIGQRQPPPTIAIYDGPPPPDQRTEISFAFPNLIKLDCRTDQTALEQFLNGLI